MRRILLLLVLSSPPLAIAASFQVTKTADTNDGSCNADCSLREAIRAANNTPGAPHMVAVPAGTYALTLGGADELAAAGDLDVQSSMQIVGAGAATTIVDAQGSDRAFHLDPEGDGAISVTLRGLTVRNGAEAFGGVIFNLANLSLEQSIVRNGTARNGGCLFSGVAFSVSATSFVNCTAQTTGDTSNGFGGAIFAFGGPMTIVDSDFSGNQASFNGGAIYRAGNTGSITGGTLSSNTAGGQGGAMELTGAATLTVNATFLDNAANDGGAISVLNGPQLTITGGTFRGNSATGVDLGGGGAIFVFGGAVDVAGAHFDANDALGEGGGAILVGGSAGSSLDVASSNFTGNVALPHGGSQLPGSNPGLGGAVLLIAGTVNTFQATTLTGNIAANSGGAFYVDQTAQLAVSGGAIAGNVAQALFGGAILNEGATSLSNLVVSGNQAAQHSGAISTSVGSLTLDGVELRDNTALSAGAIGNFSGATLTIRRSTLAQNHATGSLSASGFGGGLLFDSGNATIENSTFSANTAAAGGGISNNGGGGGATMSLYNVTIAGNTGTGSAIARFNAGTVTARNTIVSGNCNAPMTSSGGNIESSGNTCGFGLASDARNVSPTALGLAALGAYGGPTRTHDLTAASLAVDFVQPGQCTGANGATLAVDQRGEARPFDGNVPPDGVARCDSGAVERRPVDLVFRDGFE